MTTFSSTLVERATIDFQEAAGALKPYVGCFWVVTAEFGGSIHLVPDGSTAISLQFEGGRASCWLLRGPLLRPETRRYAPETAVAGIRLRPAVAHLLSGIPAYEMVGRSLCLRELPAFQGLVAARPSPGTPAEAIDALQRFLLERLCHADVHPVVAAAIREIQSAGGRLPISEVAVRCGVSLRHLSRLMRIWVGYGPKRFASIVRFQETLSRIESSRGRSAALLAVESGFFDQAHLTANVKGLSGATPGDLAATYVAEFSKTRCDDTP